MSKVRIELNSAGVREMLKSDGMKAICMQQASAIRSRCGDGYEVDSYNGKNRVNAMVFASSPKAKKENLKNNTILKAMK